MKISIFKLFYFTLFISTIIPFLPYFIPFLSKVFFGLNWTGVSWFIVLIVTLFIFYLKKSHINFPIVFWLPFALYLIFYLFFDFSFLGLQLTIQYFLPIFTGVVASMFDYNISRVKLLFNSLFVCTFIIFIFSIIFYLFFDFVPHAAVIPMFFYILSSFVLSLYFLTKKVKFVLIYLLLFLIPFLNVTRMGLLVIGSCFFLHFGNKRVSTKILSSILSAVLAFFVVTSKEFQEKTFFGGSGKITDISVDYYDNEQFNSSGRKSWQIALEPGLKASPVWGNGPRADAPVLGAVIGKEVGEAHNDYLSILYNYGIIGIVLLLLGFIFSFVELYKMSRRNIEPVFQILVLSNLTMFIGFFLFMYSDNILKYTIWFPNYFFALMGICFSIYKKGFSYN